MRGSALFLVFLVGCAPASWSAGDTFVEAGVGLTFAGDYLQTVQICEHPVNELHIESNPIMGPTCDRMPPELYFPTALAAHAGAARLMPRWARRVFQAGTIWYQLASLRKNWHAGYGFRW